MKKIKILGLLAISVIYYSCSDYVNESLSNNDKETLEEKDFEIHKLETEYNFESFTEEDQLKITMGESLENLLLSDKEYAREFLNKLVKDNQTKEFLYSEKKGTSANKTTHIKNSGKSLESLLINSINNGSIQNKGGSSEKQKRISLIERAGTILPNLVIKIPDWANVVLENIDLEKLDYAIYSGINTKDLSFQYKGKNRKIDEISSIADYIPIQIKESEKLIPLKKGTNITIWNNDLVKDHFPSLKNCEEFDRSNYILFDNSEYEFLDKMRLNDDLLNAKLWAVSLDSRASKSFATNNCTGVYQRDCVTEKNVIEGLKFSNLSTFQQANNQPGGEDIISLNYVFVASQMCGDTSVSKDCPPTTWRFVFNGKFSTFFETQLHWGHPTEEELDKVLYLGSTGWWFWKNPFYVKAIPKYYDIPVDFSAEGIYSQAVYLQNSQNGTWDGNIYGTVVSFSVYEHDDVVVKLTQTESVSVTNTTKVSSKLKLGETFNSGADFSNSVTRTSTHVYTIEAAKDVQLGQSTSVYTDQNFDNEVLFGINKTTGSINTHFAFYY